MSSVSSIALLARRSLFGLLMAFIMVGRAAAPTDLARQVIQQTSMDGVLRILTAQGGQLSDRFASDLPADLSPSLRKALDTNLDYNKMESDMASAMRARLAGATRANAANFWASSAGREIARAEAKTYASLVGDASFTTYNSVPPPTTLRTSKRSRKPWP